MRKLSLVVALTTVLVAVLARYGFDANGLLHRVPTDERPLVSDRRRDQRGAPS